MIQDTPDIRNIQGYALANIVTVSAISDLALLQIVPSETAKLDNITALRIADTIPQTGEQVSLLTTLWLYDNSKRTSEWTFRAYTSVYTDGIYSKDSADFSNFGPLYSRLQMTSVLSGQGSKGAPLVKKSGEVIGVHAGGWEHQAFSVTLDDLKHFLHQEIFLPQSKINTREAKLEMADVITPF